MVLGTSRRTVPRAFSSLSQHLSAASSIPHLTVTLLRHLGIGWKWAVCLAQLSLFAALLLPGFIQVIAIYYLSGRIWRGVSYGPKPRNTMDIYVPAGTEAACPVVIFVTVDGVANYMSLISMRFRRGGAWIIGYKAWGALLAKRLSDNGVVVCCIDYRNFPQGTVVEMLEDFNAAVLWVSTNISAFKGDPQLVFLVGQSAGAQLATLALVCQADLHPGVASKLASTPAWPTNMIRGFVGISGAYNIPALAEHFHSRGLHRTLVERIMCTRGGLRLDSVSPQHVLAQAVAKSRPNLPPCLLIHGSQDKSVPESIARSFAACLQGAGGVVELKMYPGSSHTQPLIEGPLIGGRDSVLEDVLGLVNTNSLVPIQHAPLLPHLCAVLASIVCPF